MKGKAKGKRDDSLNNSITKRLRMRNISEIEKYYLCSRRLNNRTQATN